MIGTSTDQIKRYLVVLQRMSYYYNDISATCPTCYRVFNSSNNKRANQNSMEQHQQVRIFFVERFRLKDLEIMEFRCTGPRSTLAPFAECRNSGAKKIDLLSHKEKLTKTATGLRQMLCSTWRQVLAPTAQEGRLQGTEFTTSSQGTRCGH